MDFKQLEVFVSVVKHESFSKAARELFLTQPTVSSHIQNLEKELNTVLLNRNNKTIKLTESGEILYKHAIYILNNCKKAICDIKEYSGKIEGLIDIACSSIPETYILPEFMKSFISEFPHVQFSINHHDSQYAISEILNERISFGFVGVKPNNSQIKSIKILDDELVLITSKDLDVKNENGYIGLSELSNFKFIMRKDGSATRGLILDILRKNNFPYSNLNVVAHVESNESIKEMVKLGLGVSFVSYMSAVDYINDNKLNFYRVKNIKFNRNFYFIYSKQKVLTPLEDRFISELYAYFNIEK